MTATRPCTVAGCDRTVHAKGFCVRHYQKWRRTGVDPTADHNPPPAHPPVVVACPEDLEPLVAQLVENDARQIFTLLWRAIGNWHLQGADVAS